LRIGGVALWARDVLRLLHDAVVVVIATAPALTRSVVLIVVIVTATALTVCTDAGSGPILFVVLVATGVGLAGWRLAALIGFDLDGRKFFFVLSGNEDESRALGALDFLAGKVATDL
jgi:hypothetical protein